MNSQFNWVTDLFDEMSLVYEKAEKNDSAGQLLEQLENSVLEECAAAVSEGGLLTARVGSTLTREQFFAMPEADRETAVRMLADTGFGGFSQNLAEGTLSVRLTSAITRTQACTVFKVLNLLEKLDGTLNVLRPKWTLELQVPLGGRKGLVQWEMLTMMLYPWLSIREVATREVVPELLEEKPAEKAPEKPPETAAAPQEKPAPAPVKQPEEKPVKPSFLSRLFKKRKA